MHHASWIKPRSGKIVDDSNGKIVDDSFNYHWLSLTIMSAFKRFVLFDDSCPNHSMRSRCSRAPILLSRKIFHKHGLSYKSTYQTTTPRPILWANFRDFCDFFSLPRFERYCRQNHGLVLPRMITPRSPFSVWTVFEPIFFKTAGLETVMHYHRPVQTPKATCRIWTCPNFMISWLWSMIVQDSSCSNSCDSSN